MLLCNTNYPLLSDFIINIRCLKHMFCCMLHVVAAVIVQTIIVDVLSTCRYFSVKYMRSLNLIYGSWLSFSNMIWDAFWEFRFWPTFTLCCYRTIFNVVLYWTIIYWQYLYSMASCQKGPSCHDYAWQIGPFWQDTLVVDMFSRSWECQCSHSYLW